ncbi:MAG: inorganic pyrophosphatase [Oscillospiraceae bacterium]|nr:inorganic pyrophosphatase [Oscillospiraceae bacterium]MBQ9958911.1 inorganic pyrophosphatase [Oscillospiraceae bacterium]
MEQNKRFWQMLDELVRAHPITLDRPKGSYHPTRGEVYYEHDYGYLEGTASPDGEEIDVWLGESRELRVTGVLMTVDIWKHDCELKLLVGCSREEMQSILAFYGRYSGICGKLTERDD